MVHQTFFVCVFLIVCCTTRGAFCSGSPKSGDSVNNNKISDSSLKREKSVLNGVLYTAGPDNARFNIVHVYGTPYEMGYAQGELVGDIISQFVHGVFNYIIDAALDPEKFPHIPLQIKQMIIEKGIDNVLDWNAKVTKEFTPDSYFEELQGLADSIPSITYNDLLRLQMFPEITKASCSFFGSWSTASYQEHTFHMRSLDYDVDGPFLDYPQVIIYHPTTTNGNDKSNDEQNTFASVGWPASIGVLTGMNNKKMGINEIGVSFPDDSFGQGTPDTPPEKVKGKPWMFVVRDILQKSSTLSDAIESVQQTPRTCNLIVGVGDGKEDKEAAIPTPQVNGIEYSGYVAIPYNDKNQLPVNSTWHPVLENVVYNGMDWLCPTFTSVLGEQLTKYHGQISQDNIIKNILPTVQTGNLHIGLYDLTDNIMYVSFARKSQADPTEPLYAYQRQFTQLDMTSIFAEPKPQK
jgi:hypothetical protein